MPPNAPLSTSPGGDGPGGKTSMGLDANVAGMLSYLSMFCCFIGIIVSLVFFLTEKTNRFVRFHAMQALLLAGTSIGIGIVFRILATVLSLSDLGILVWGLLAVRLVISLIFLVAFVLTAIKAYQGEMYKIPVIGDLAENIAGK